MLSKIQFLFHISLFLDFYDKVHCVCRGTETNFEKGARSETRNASIVEDELIKNQHRRRDAALHLKMKVLMVIAVV